MEDDEQHDETDHPADDLEDSALLGGADERDRDVGHRKRSLVLRTTAVPKRATAHPGEPPP